VLAIGSSSFPDTEPAPNNPNLDPTPTTTNNTASYSKKITPNQTHENDSSLISSCWSRTGTNKERQCYYAWILMTQSPTSTSNVASDD